MKENITVFFDVVSSGKQIVSDMADKNFRIAVEYDGSRFYGWQVQTGKMTVQGELEKILSMVLNQRIKVSGSGRTDAGVHAVGQVANFHADTDISPEDLKRALNSLLKVPAVIRSCSEVSHEFHARYSAISKEYHYHILNGGLPPAIGADYQWHIPKPLDVDTMNICCEMIEGEHDFKSFEASGSPRESTVRTIYSAKVYTVEDLSSPGCPDPDRYIADRGEREPGIAKRIVFKIAGNGFLRFMVRNIVGTLVMVGQSRIAPEGFRKILESRDRTVAGATAPARGLFLMSVKY